MRCSGKQQSVCSHDQVKEKKKTNKHIAPKREHCPLGLTKAWWHLMPSPGSTFHTSDGSLSAIMAAVGHLVTRVVGSFVLGSSEVQLPTWLRTGTCRITNTDTDCN